VANGSNEQNVERHTDQTAGGDAGTTLARASQSEAQLKAKTIARVLDLPPDSYNDVVGNVITNNLRRNPNGHQVLNSDMRSYGNIEGIDVIQRDPNTGAAVIDKATGKPQTVDASTLTNGQLADALQGAIKQYKANEAEFEGIEHSRGLDKVGAELTRTRPLIEAKVKETMLSVLTPEALRDPNIGDKVGSLLTSKDAPPPELFKTPEALQQFLTLRSEVQAFNAKSDHYRDEEAQIRSDMTKQGKFFPGKMQFCCCTNARNKSLGMMSWMLTGKQLDGSSCHRMNLKNMPDWSSAEGEKSAG